MVLSLFPPVFDYLSSETLQFQLHYASFSEQILNFAHAEFLFFSISLPSFLTEKLIFIFQGPLFLLFSCSVVSDSLRPHGLQHARLPSPSPSPGACSNSCPLSWWCHPTISSSAAPISSCLLSFPASGSFPMSWFFALSGQTMESSVSVLPMNIRDWFPSRLTGRISLQSKGLSRVFSSTTVRKHQFFSSHLSLQSNS